MQKGQVQAELFARLRAARLGIYEKLTGRGSGVRDASFPLVSGDTFRAMSDIVLESPYDALSLKETLEKCGSNEPMIFLPLHLLNDLVESIESTSVAKAIFILHNGDVLDESAVIRLSQRAGRVFSVNWLGSSDIAIPIPIGVENRHWNINGRPELISGLNPARLPNLIGKDREITVLGAFSSSTNSAMRTGVLETFGGSPGALLLTKRVEPRRYWSLLAQSLFVISPPGNGPDCHRTWEAMYSGAIPIVLEGSWPFRDEPLPALTVSNWEHARKLIDEGKDDLYEQIWSEADVERLYFPYYLQLLKSRYRWA